MKSLHQTGTCSIEVKTRSETTHEWLSLAKESATIIAAVILACIFLRALLSVLGVTL